MAHFDKVGKQVETAARLARAAARLCMESRVSDGAGILSLDPAYVKESDQRLARVHCSAAYMAQVVGLAISLGGSFSVVNREGAMWFGKLFEVRVELYGVRFFGMADDDELRLLGIPVPNQPPAVVDGQLLVQVPPVEMARRQALIEDALSSLPVSGAPAIDPAFEGADGEEARVRCPACNGHPDLVGMCSTCGGQGLVPVSESNKFVTGGEV